MASVPRHDPPSVVAHGHRQFEVLKNADPKRKYLWANPNDPEFGLDPALATGWEQEFHRKGGPHSAFMKPGQDGTPITQRGYVLVSMPLEAFEQEFTSAAAAREIATERAVRKGRTGVAEAPSHLHHGVTLQNQTSPEFRERA